MPKTSVDENASAVLAQHKVGMAWEPWVIEPIAESVPPEVLAHQYLRLRILAPNRSHVSVSVLWGMYVHAFLLLPKPSPPLFLGWESNLNKPLRKDTKCFPKKKEKPSKLTVDDRL
jgi:hypothetical protein